MKDNSGRALSSSTAQSVKNLGVALVTTVISVSGALVTLNALAQSTAPSTVSASVSSDAAAVGKSVRDTTVTAKVKAALLATKDLSSGDIHVTTHHGTVNLAGSVPSAEQKAMAVDVASKIEGARKVHDALEVRAH
ncbi:BON domain-containing protein [Paraburkholderia bonniea]|uniref:BON domain-containing protein n=1 Tax=Paraburkholderia bonniea TaxID=2152891 RepID=UPI001FE7D1A8|nr:BON domain-containing protein [Paraburkholderia bonniea]WJF89068.1 BON domain-containing protein [Paraburkholderia bonniea]WJF92384.1 BON domain-containing protein [Paraburkholderia bonniea]